MHRSHILPSLPVCVATVVLALGPATAAHAGLFGKDSAVPQWGLDAAKTKTPDYAKDSGSVILFDEYVETVDGQGRATEREREAIRILEAAGTRHSL